MYPRLFEMPGFGIGPITVYTYGVLLAAAYLLGLQLAMVRAQGARPRRRRACSTSASTSSSARSSARSCCCSSPTSGRSRDDPRELLTLARSGGVFYGGLILAVVVALWYIRRVGLPLWTTCDVFAPGIALGHVVGRFGCFFAGCCYGKPTTRAVGHHVHRSVRRRQRRHAADVPLHPTQLYEAGAELLILVAAARRPNARAGRSPGRTFWLYMLLYAISRFIIEFYRGDERGTVGIFSTSQFISLILAPLAIVMLVYLGAPRRARRRSARASEGGVNQPRFTVPDDERRRPPRSLPRLGARRPLALADSAADQGRPRARRRARRPSRISR